MLSPTVVRCDKELEILHAVYLSVIIPLVIIIVVISVIHWRIRRGPGTTLKLLSIHSLRMLYRAVTRRSSETTQVLRTSKAQALKGGGDMPPSSAPKKEIKF